MGLEWSTHMRNELSRHIPFKYPKNKKCKKHPKRYLRWFFLFPKTKGQLSWIVPFMRDMSQEWVKKATLIAVVGIISTSPSANTAIITIYLDSLLVLLLWVKALPVLSIRGVRGWSRFQRQQMAWPSLLIVVSWSEIIQLIHVM